MPTQPIEKTTRAQEYGVSEREANGTPFELHRDDECGREDASNPTEERSGLVEALLDLMADADGLVSFQDVADYREALEDRWDRRVAADLTAAGVNVSRRFRLTLDDESGHVTANDEHPHSRLIDDYFRTTPDAAQEFQRLVQLGKLADAPRRRLTARAREERLPAAVVAAWYHRNMDTASLSLGGGLLFGQGRSTFTGLNIRV